MSVQRPLSPFMIGSYYRPQLTSVLSILHRITGLFLCLGAIGLIAWIVALASGPQAYAGFANVAHGPLGKLLLVASVFALCYHLGNGIRHLFWDAGRGFELKSAYASGYAVIAFSIVATAGVLLLAGGAR
ncbi:MAG: succinate dehydrogenase, cytochrome b556 subunit [Xanthomonadales bacterium]|nr:succinate dehydrogenase, cytochrome b556 subunit [Xanthomonadales bacterium]